MIKQTLLIILASLMVISTEAQVKRRKGQRNDLDMNGLTIYNSKVPHYSADPSLASDTFPSFYFNTTEGCLKFADNSATTYSSLITQQYVDSIGELQDTAFDASLNTLPTAADLHPDTKRNHIAKGDGFIIGTAGSIPSLPYDTLYRGDRLTALRNNPTQPHEWHITPGIDRINSGLSNTLQGDYININLTANTDYTITPVGGGGDAEHKFGDKKIKHYQVFHNREEIDLFTTLDTISNTILLNSGVPLNNVFVSITGGNNNIPSSQTTSLPALDDYDIIFGVLRNTGSTWDFISDASHQEKGFASVTTQTGGIIRVDYNQTYSEIGTFIAVPDEKYATIGVSVGSSADLDHASIYLSQRNNTIADLVWWTGTSWRSPYTQFTNITYTNGVLSLNHDYMSGFGVNITPKDPNPYTCRLGNITNTSFEVLFYNPDGTQYTGPINGSMDLSLSRTTKSGLLNHTESEISGANIWILGILKK